MGGPGPVRAVQGTCRRSVSTRCSRCAATCRVDELPTFDKGDSRLQGHPDVTRLPGLDASTGSLGQGLSVGVGMALGARLGGKSFHTWVMLGDGEIQEGMVWEAVQVAARYKLSNLTAIIDRNGLQQFGLPSSSETSQTDRGDRRDPWFGVDLAAVFQAFGWRVIEIDGHDYEQIDNAYRLAQAGDFTGRPTVIIAHTVKGKGLSLAEGVHTWHSIVPSAEDFERARQELEADELDLLDVSRPTSRRSAPPQPAPLPARARTEFQREGDEGRVGREAGRARPQRSADGRAGRRPGELDQGGQVRQGAPGPVLSDGHRRAEPDRCGRRAGRGRVTCRGRRRSPCSSPTGRSTRSGCWWRRATPTSRSPAPTPVC